MLNFIWLFPIYIRTNTQLYYKYKPFTFPDNCYPNISDPSTYETIDNITQLQELIEYAINSTIFNDLHWEEVINFTKKSIIT